MEARCPRGPGAATTVTPQGARTPTGLPNAKVAACWNRPCKRNLAVRFEGRKHQELLSSRTRIPCYRTANTTQAHGGTTHALIGYTAGWEWPQGPNIHSSTAANSAERNKYCTDANSWLRHKPNVWKHYWQCMYFHIVTEFLFLIIDLHFMAKWRSFFNAKEDLISSRT